jgi:hypothetical protein
MYFPIKELREKWINNYDEFNIGFPLLDIDGNLTNIIGYNKKGEKYFLDIKRIPDLPILVVYLSENREEAKKPLNNVLAKREDDIMSVNIVMLKQIAVDFINIGFNYDQPSWLYGDMEVEFKLKNSYGNYVNGGTVWDGVNAVIYDTDHHTWWCYDEWGSVTQHWYDLFYLYNKSDDGGFYGTLTIEVWEQDVGDDDYIATINNISVTGSGTYNPGGMLEITIRCCGITQSDLEPLEAPAWFCNYEE